MKTRFKKVWCGSCSFMVFVGECGHGRIEEPPPDVVYQVRRRTEGSFSAELLSFLMKVFAQGPRLKFENPWPEPADNHWTGSGAGEAE